MEQEPKPKVVIIKQKGKAFSATDGELFTIGSTDKSWVIEGVKHELQKRIDNGRWDKLFIIQDENAQKSA